LRVRPVFQQDFYQGSGGRTQGRSRGLPP
jgi:hypothetical protein